MASRWTNHVRPAIALSRPHRDCGRGQALSKSLVNLRDYCPYYRNSLSILCTDSANILTNVVNLSIARRVHTPHVACSALPATSPESVRKRVHALAIDRVILHTAVRSDAYHTRSLQQRQVARHRRLGNAKPPDNLLRIQLTGREQLDDPQPVRLAQRPQRLKQIIIGERRNRVLRIARPVQLPTRRSQCV